MTEDDTCVARIAELEADNRRLRRLLDQRDAPGELRHRLRNTVALLRAVIRTSGQTARTLESYIGHIEDRLDALARAQAAADDHGVVEIHTLLADEFLHYSLSEGDRVALSGPDVELQPRAGQVFALAAHELAVNAVEHGALGTSTGRIEIGWSIATHDGGPVLTLIWQEHDVTSISAPTHQGFGMEVLTRMLPYNLNAEAKLVFEPRGLCCTIRLPLAERIS